MNADVRGRALELFEAAKAELVQADHGEVFVLMVPIYNVLMWDSPRRARFAERARRAATEAIDLLLLEELAEGDNHG